MSANQKKKETDPHHVHQTEISSDTSEASGFKRGVKVVLSEVVVGTKYQPIFVLNVAHYHKMPGKRKIYYLKWWFHGDLPW